MQVFSSAGMQIMHSGSRLYWTVGEPLMQKLKVDEGRLMQGFQQKLSQGILEENDSTFTPTVRAIGDNLVYYPNPVRNRLTIEDPDRVVNNIMVYDQSGNLVIDTFREDANQIFIVDMSSLPNGLFFFRVLTEEDQLIKRFRVLKQS